MRGRAGAKLCQGRCFLVEEAVGLFEVKVKSQAGPDTQIVAGEGAVVYFEVGCV